MNEYLEKQTDGTYKLVMRGDACKNDDIEIPEGAEVATICRNYIIFWKDEKYSFSVSEENKWCYKSCDDSRYFSLGEYMNEYGDVSIIWQREPELPFNTDLEDVSSQWDIQVGGDHYKSMKIQPAQFALENKLDYCQANAIKYICRHKSKNGKQDLEKAKHYIDLLIEHYYGNS